MDAAVRQQIDELRRLTTKQLKVRFAEVFGRETRSNHKQYLFRRVARRLQALAEGDLSERTRKRALDIANDADLRVRAPKGFFDADETVQIAPHEDQRLPLPGTLLTSEYQGETVVVKVLQEGFVHRGQMFVRSARSPDT